MSARSKIAHHEAAHSVMAVALKRGLSGGIDLDAPTSVQGATGVSAVNLFAPDASQSIDEQRNDVVYNLAIICAGAASDAKLSGTSLTAALQAQPGDHQAAKTHALLHPIVSSPTDADDAITVAIEVAEKWLAQPKVWTAVEAVATACLANGGKLAKAEIEALTAHL